MTPRRPTKQQQIDSIIRGARPLLMLLLDYEVSGNEGETFIDFMARVSDAENVERLIYNLREAIEDVEL
jgi:hypothetical protein